MENPNPIDASAISVQVNRILCSRSFASKSQLRKLLEVLSKHIDSQTTLTPDLVIKELWPGETKTKRSADVATEMNRLRHALESYYGREGEADPNVIVLPNRAVPAADGTHETRWIVANPRDGTQDSPARNHLPALQVNPRGGRKKIAMVTAPPEQLKPTV